MGRKKWNANSWHRQHTNRPFYRRLGLPGLATFGVFAVLIIATGAVAVAQQGEGQTLPEDKIGICHATGSEEQPFVFVVVARNGAQHGHHEQHEEDILDVQTPSDCGIDEGPAEPEPDVPGDNETTCDHEEDPNTTASPSPSSPAPSQSPSSSSSLCDADLAASKDGSLEGDQVVFTLAVENLGPGEANRALLYDLLPDVGRPWELGGADAAECDLADLEVRCDFGDLAAGENRTVTATALHCPQDCGDDLENTVRVHAVNDGNATNDQATAIVEIEDCPEGDEWDWINETDEPPADNETPPEDNGTDPPADDNDTTPPDNGTDNDTDEDDGNETDGNQTEKPRRGERPRQNRTEPEPEPEDPALGDVRVSQAATQTNSAVSLVITVTNIGTGPVAGVSLSDTLPDVRRAWMVTGADAGDCTLEGQALACNFGALDANESRTLELRAYTDRMACGEHLVNTVTVSAEDDSVLTNNRSSASIEARSC